MARDQIKVSINYTYTTQTADNSNANGITTLVNSLASMIMNSSDVTAGIHNAATTLANNQGGDPGIQSVFNTYHESVTSGSTTQPKACLHVLLFNDQFVFDNVHSFVQQIDASGYNAEGTIGPITITVGKSGYAYIYFSNESNTIVYFDNFMLTHLRGQILEATNYYPFGLTVAGISSKAAGGLENKYKYNRIEFDEDLGLDTYEAFYRNLDPQIGRFWQSDPQLENLDSYSPYKSMGNNPILNCDPLGNWRHRFGAWLWSIFNGGGKAGTYANNQQIAADWFYRNEIIPIVFPHFPGGLTLLD